MPRPDEDIFVPTGLTWPALQAHCLKHYGRELTLEDCRRLKAMWMESCPELAEHFRQWETARAAQKQGDPMAGFKLTITIHAPNEAALSDAAEALASFFCDYANNAEGLDGAYCEIGEAQPDMGAEEVGLACAECGREYTVDGYGIARHCDDSDPINGRPGPDIDEDHVPFGPYED